MTAPDTAPDSGTDSPSLLEDLIDIWFNPGAVFARRAGRNPWLPFLLVSVLLCGVYFAVRGSFQAVIDAEVNRAVAQAMADNPSMSAEQQTAMRNVVEISITWGGILFMPIVLLLLGLSTWLVGRVFGGALGFGTGLMIASFAYVPKVLDLVLAALQSMLMDTSDWSGRYQFSLGVGRFLDPEMNQGLLNLVGRIDLFTIWVTVLLGIGLMAAGKLPKARAVPAAVTLWVVGALPALWQLISGG